MSSPATSPSQDTSPGGSPSALDGKTDGSAPLPRRPIPRKGHTKSRRGCFNCKRRKIKCSERHPTCNHCHKSGLQCQYPTFFINSVPPQRPTSPHPQEVSNLRATPGIFSMADMRLFHHFLITAYPCLPVGADKIWIAVIPSFAHNYEYLIHSILALAASHLDAVSNAHVADQAIQHRILAVQSLNEALSEPPKTKCERDARMAAALALAFQSSHLADGMAEFLTMVRGCNLIAGNEDALGVESVSNAFHEDNHLAGIRSRINTSEASLNWVSRTDLNLAMASLNAILPLDMSTWEHSYWTRLRNSVSAAYERPADAYSTFVNLYNAPSRWSHDEFQAFIDPNNAVAQILLAHFIAIQAILTPLLYLERVGFQGIDAPSAVLGWIEGVYGNLPEHLRHHVEWPRAVSTYPFSKLLGERQVVSERSPEEVGENNFEAYWCRVDAGYG